MAASNTNKLLHLEKCSVYISWCRSRNKQFRAEHNISRRVFSVEDNAEKRLAVMEAVLLRAAVFVFSPMTRLALCSKNPKTV